MGPIFPRRERREEVGGWVGVKGMNSRFDVHISYECKCNVNSERLKEGGTVSSDQCSFIYAIAGIPLLFVSQDALKSPTLLCNCIYHIHLSLSCFFVT